MIRIGLTVSVTLYEEVPGTLADVVDWHVGPDHTVTLTMADGTIHACPFEVRSRTSDDDFGQDRLWLKDTDTLQLRDYDFNESHL
jgi:hypothetical protein